MDTKHIASRALSVVVPAAMFVAAGILFWGVPAASDELPDPDDMALLGNERKSNDEIIELWERKRADAPLSGAIRAQLASAELTRAGDNGDLAGYELAAATAREAVELAPGDQHATLVLAAALSGQHDFAGALDLAEQVLADDPESVGANLAAGDAHLELGNVAAARGHYSRAAELAGGAPAVLSREARLASIAGTLDEAHDLARRALVAAADEDLRHADAAFFWFQLATFSHQRGDAVAARELLNDALSIDPGHGPSTELLGKVLVALGEYDEATKLYEAMVDGGGAADLHGELAKLYAVAGRDVDAREQIALGLAVADRDGDRYPAERRHLIGFLADHDPAEALRLAELDLAERQDVYSHAWVAWALFLNGRFDEAADAIRPALVYRTEDAFLRYQAGAIMAAVGATEQARELLESALELNPSFDLVHAERARRILDDL